MSVATAVFADWNLPNAQVADLAHDAGCRMVHGDAPDHAIVRDLRTPATRVLGKLGSDHHHALLHRLEVGGIQVRALQWNVWVGQRPDAVDDTLRGLIRQHDLDVIALQEAYRLGEVLARLDGYRVRQGPNVGEGADCALLVAKRHRWAYRGTARMRERWIGPERPKEPREFPFGRIELDGTDEQLRAMVAHFPTGGLDGRNAAAVREARARTIRWAQPRQKENPS